MQPPPPPHTQTEAGCGSQSFFGPNTAAPAGRNACEDVPQKQSEGFKALCQATFLPMENHGSGWPDHYTACFALPRFTRPWLLVICPRNTRDPILEKIPPECARPTNHRCLGAPCIKSDPAFKTFHLSIVQASEKVVEPGVHKAL